MSPSAPRPAAGASAPDSVVELATPAYWQEACRHLARKDRVMKRLIPEFGNTTLRSRGWPPPTALR